MNSKKHTLSRKVIATLLTVAMLVTMFPATMFASEPGSGEITSVSTAKDSPIQIKKSIEKDSEGNLQLVIDAWATGEKTITEKVKPVDIVLVLDQSGSMAEGTGEVNYQYTALEKNEWSYNDVVNKKYYFYDESSGKYYRVIANKDGGYFEQKTYWLSYGDENSVTQLGEKSSNRRDTIFTGTLYTRQTSETTKLSALQSAVTSFVDTVKRNSPSEGSHNIALVGFASGYSWNHNTYSYNNTGLFVGDNFYRYNGGDRTFDESDEYAAQKHYSEALKDADDSSIQYSINALDANGGTLTNYGIEMANGILSTVNDPDREKVIIVFTDGEPGWSGYDSTTAKEAIDQANIARDNGATVYSVGVFGSNHNEEQTDSFMTSLAGDASRYFVAENAEGLTAIFEKIADEIGSASVEADETSVLNDVLTDNFVVDSAREATVQKVPYNGNGSWGTPADSGLQATIEGKSISVTGFDYSENYVWDNGGNHGGYALRLTIPIKADTGCTSWGPSGFYDTNASTSLSYGEDQKTTLDGSPNAWVDTYQVTYNSNGGSEVKDTRNYISGQTATVKEAPTKTGYTFKGWKLDENMTYQPGNTFNVTKSVTLTAQWEEDTYTLNYNANGGKFDGDNENIHSVTGLLEQTNYKLASASDLNLSHADEEDVPVLFVGWTEKSDQTAILEQADKDKLTELVQTVDLTADKTDNKTANVYAVWGYDRNGNDIPDVNEDTYTLNYNANGGKFDGDNENIHSVTGLLEQTNYKLASASDLNLGHADEEDVPVLFVGWTEKSDQTAILEQADKDKLTGLVQTVDLTADKTDNKTANVYAVWGYDRNGNDIPDVNEDTYTLNYNANGGKFDGDNENIHSVTGLLEQTNYKLASASDLNLGHADEEDVPVLFVGWTEKSDQTAILEQADKDKLTGLVQTVDLTADKTDNKTANVYAVWGYDRNGNDIPDVNEDTYTLNYNANGGKFDGDNENIHSVTGLLEQTNYKLASASDLNLGHADEEDVPVLFVGWTEKSDQTAILEQADKDKLTGLVQTVDLTADKTDNKTANVYAVWGYDRNNNGTPDVNEETYTLTYNATSGSFDDNNTTIATVHDVTANEKLNLWSTGDGTIPEGMMLPTHDDAQTPEDSVITDATTVPVVMIGWSLTDPGNEIYAAGEQYPATTKTVKIPSDKEGGNEIVYAVWGYDTNDDGIADATQVMIQPAAITIYTGGTGYTGVVTGENGETVAVDQDGNGLPEPGFYFTLPYDVNEAIRNDAGNADKAADLSQYLTINAGEDSSTGTDKDRTWTVALYDPDGNSKAYDKYVYSFQEQGDTTSVRMQFVDPEDPEGKIIYSDEFDINNALSEKYIMSLYTGAVENGKITATVTIDDKASAPISIGLLDSTLTIRGTTGDGQSNEIATTVGSAVTSITASTENGKLPTYYINDSQIRVTNQNAVKLLVDSIVDSELSEGQYVHDTLLDMAKDENALPSSYDGVEFKYLDLVDSSNGNVWVTMGDDDSLTVYWPYPAGTDKNDDFTIIHYKGLDRDFDLSDLKDQESTIEVLSTENGKLECTDKGIKFTVSSFSPFALVYDADQGSGGTTPTPPDLNTEDHFSYVVGYEDGMVKPENAITRAEVASIFYRLLKDDVRDANTTDVSEFSDVSASDWYGTTVATLSAMDIVRGYEDGTFRPNAPITRAEFAAIATRFFEETGAEYEPGTFDDVTGDEWFANAIADAVELGLIGGYPDGTVRPNNNITRAEACAIVNRTLGRIPHVDHLLPADEMTTWPDNNPSDWFYADMQEATNGHEYEWTTEQGQKVEEWTEILDKDWEDR